MATKKETMIVISGGVADVQSQELNNSDLAVEIAMELARKTAKRFKKMVAELDEESIGVIVQENSKLEEAEVVEADPEGNDYSELRSIIQSFVGDEEAFGKQLEKLPGGTVKELKRICPELNLDTVLFASDVGNGCLIFTTAAMYVRTGNRLTGKYIRVPYGAIDYESMATGAGKAAGTRKLILPYTDDDNNRINIIIDDTRITEERLQELLQEISESGCLVANTDSNIHMPALGTDQQVLYFQALGNIMNREDRCLTELFLIVKDYGLEAKWNEIAEAFGDDNDLEKRINSFLTTIPYPSEAHISVQAVTLALQTIFRTNSLEGKELSMLSAETEGLIKKFDVIGISEKDFNKLIKAAAGSKRKANIQDVYDIEERLDDSISYYDRIKEGCSAISKIVQEAIDKKNEKKNKKSFGDVIKDVVPDKAEKIFDGFAKLGKKDSLELPPEYVELKQKLPEDLGVPKDAVGYGMRTEAASAMLISYPVTEKESMPFGDAQWIIDEMHRIMGDNEGLIEVKTGETDKGCPYSYDIIKHRFEYEEGGPAYVEYTININVKQEKEIQFINGSFKEEGITGARESQTMMMVAQANDMSLEEVANNWCEDPYDPDYKKGFLMNRAEKEELDEAFPWHALSEARNLLRYIIENN